MKKNERKYVVGYHPKGTQHRGVQCVYGADIDGRASYTNRMTLNRARAKLNELASTDSDAAIYELVPVWIGKPKPRTASRGGDA